MNKLKCIKCSDTNEVLRVTEKEAIEIMTEDMNWHYTSKSVYKKYLKSKLPKFTSGIYFGSPKSKIKDEKKYNNRKRTRGRKIYYMPVNIRKIKNEIRNYIIKDRTIVKKALGFILHSSIKYKSGNTIVKQGKGKCIKFVETIHKNEQLLKSDKTIKQVIR